MKNQTTHNVAYHQPQFAHSGAWLSTAGLVLYGIFVCLLSVTVAVRGFWQHLNINRRLIRGLTISLVIGFALLISANLVSAAITKVQDLGTANSKTTNTTLAVTLAAGVTDGNSVIVTFAMDSATGTISCADDAGTSNSYSVDVDVNNTGSVRTAIISAHNVSGLTSGKVITITHPSVAARGMSVTEFSGLAKISQIDQTQSNTGSTIGVSSNATGTTTTPDELLIGAIGEEGKLVDGFTPGTSWTGLPRDGTSTGSPASNVTISPEYRIVSATGTYTADGTLSKAKNCFTPLFLTLHHILCSK